MKGRKWVALVTAISVLWHAAVGCCAHHHHDSSTHCGSLCSHVSGHCDNHESACESSDEHDDSSCCHHDHDSLVSQESHAHHEEAIHAHAGLMEARERLAESFPLAWTHHSEDDQRHAPCAEGSCCLTAPSRSETCISLSLFSVLAHEAQFDSVVPLSLLQASERVPVHLNSQGSSSAHPRHLLLCVLIQ